MSSLQETGKWSSCEAVEMSKFSEKCSLLSQYLQENVTFGDKNFRVVNRESQAPGSETAMSEKAAESSRQGTMMTTTGQKHAGFSLPSSQVNDKADFKKLAAMEYGTAQMTMLYGGQILVFDDFPADKVREIISLAGGKQSSNICGSGKSSHVGTNSGSNIGSRSTKTEHHDPLLEGMNIQSGDVPIARRVSLHRFLEKRKDRVAKSPYPVGQTSADAANPEWNPSINMEHQPTKDHEQFDLKL